MNEVVRVDCIKHHYEDGTSFEFCNTHLSVKAGERLVIIGPNGSGKTTLLLHLVGLLKPREGKVAVLGATPGSPEFDSMLPRIGMVFQNVEEQLIAPTVYDDIAFSPINYGVATPEIKKRVTAIMNALGISSLAEKVPHYLSGGEQKKVALAGALVMEPEILLLDEFFANVDGASTKQILAYLKKLNREKKMTIILTTHSLEITRAFATKVLKLGRSKGGFSKFRGCINEEITSA